MNFDRLRFVAERAELGEHREAVLAVTIPEKPGSFRALCELLGPAQRHRVQLPHRATPSEAHVFVGVTVARPRGDRPAHRAAASARGSKAVDLSDNEMAKLHVRHLVGGHAPARRGRDALPLRVPGAARAR